MGQARRVWPMLFGSNAAARQMQDLTSGASGEAEPDPARRIIRAHFSCRERGERTARGNVAGWRTGGQLMR